MMIAQISNAVDLSSNKLQILVYFGGYHDSSSSVDYRATCPNNNHNYDNNNHDVQNYNHISLFSSPPSLCKHVPYYDNDPYNKWSRIWLWNMVVEISEKKIDREGKITTGKTWVM